MRPRRKRRFEKNRKKGIYILPNLITSASLFGGFYAIISSINGHFEAAATAILISCLFDTLDGKIARITNTASHFGSEYDSLSDLVAFGVAPGILAFTWALQPFGRLGWLACFMYLICGALRLARFNVQKNIQEPKYFKGLPIPAGASVIATLVLFMTSIDTRPESINMFIIIMIYLLSFLMVSPIKYPSFKEVEIRKQKPFNLFISVIFVFIVIAYQPHIMLFFIAILYTFSGPSVSIYMFHKRKSMPPIEPNSSENVT